MDSRLEGTTSNVPPPSSVYDLGDCIFNAEHAELLSKTNGQHLHLEKKVAQVLRCLANAKGDVVTREEIFSEVWPKIIVSDDSLNRCISVLRKNLKTFDHQLSIKTHPKIGFNLESSSLQNELNENLSIDTSDNKLSSVTLQKIIYFMFAVNLLLLYLVIKNYMAAPTTNTLAFERNKIVIYPFTHNGDKSNIDSMFEPQLRQLLSGLEQIEILSLNGDKKQYLTPPLELAQKVGAKFIIQGNVYHSDDRNILDWKIIDGAKGTILYHDLLNISLNSTAINVRKVIADFAFIQAQVRYPDNKRSQSNYLVKVAKHLFYPQSSQEYQRPVIYLLARTIEEIDGHNMSAIKTLSSFISEAQWSSKVNARPHINMAINLLRRSLARHPKDSDIYQILSKLYISIYQWKKANDIVLSGLSYVQASTYKQKNLLYSIKRHTGHITSEDEVHFLKKYNDSPLVSKHALDLITYYLDTNQKRKAIEIADFSPLSQSDLLSVASTLGPIFIKNGEIEKGRRLTQLGYSNLGLDTKNIDLLITEITNKTHSSKTSNLVSNIAKSEIVQDNVKLKIYAELGDTEKFYDLAFIMSESYQFDNTVLNQINPEILRKSPRFFELMKKVGLTSFWEETYLPSFCKNIQVRCI